MGYDVHIECQGQRGKEYPLTQEEIDRADLIIFVLDIGIDMTPFNGKDYYRFGTHEVTKSYKSYSRCKKTCWRIKNY